MTDPDERFQRLRMQYAQSLPAKRAALAEAWRAYLAAPDDAALQRELSMQLHRLAGSAGAYGYEAVGVRARAADRLAGDAQARADARALDAGVQAVLDALSDAIASSSRR